MNDHVQAPVIVDLSRYIEVRLMEKRPHIHGRRVPVALIAYSARSQGWDVPELAYEFTLTEVEVLAALLYYQQNQAVVDAIEAEEQTKMNEMFRLYGRQN